MHPDRCSAIAIDPFWSRNRLTFLQIARYHRHARFRFNAWGGPYGRELAPDASSALRRYFAEVGKVVAI
jgi:hypothetical protein